MEHYLEVSSLFLRYHLINKLAMDYNNPELSFLFVRLSLILSVDYIIAYPNFHVLNLVRTLVRLLNKMKCLITFTAL